MGQKGCKEYDAKKFIEEMKASEEEGFCNFGNFDLHERSGLYFPDIVI